MKHEHLEENAVQHDAHSMQERPPHGSREAMSHTAHGEHAHHGGTMEHESHGNHGEHGGHDAHTDHSGHEQMFRTRFWGSLLLSIPVLVIACPHALGLAVPLVVAIESAGIILVQSNPLDVVKIIALSRASYHKMVQNLWWAAGYNIIALPLAAGILAPWGVNISPAFGALLMSLSTVIVAINAQFLRNTRFDLMTA